MHPPAGLTALIAATADPGWLFLHFEVGPLASSMVQVFRGEAVIEQRAAIGARRANPPLRPSLSRLVMAAWIGIAAAASAPLPARAETPKPRHIVSLNVCADQLLMLLVPKDRIAALSFLARDPEVSALADRAASLPVTYGNAEQIITIKPDLILAGAYTRTDLSLLRRLGFKVVEIVPANTLAEVLDNIRAVGKAVGEEARADQMADRFRRRLAALGPKQGKDPMVVPLYANAYTSGPGTLVDSVLEEAGLTSIGRELGLAGMQKLSLETLLISRPDGLLLPDRRYSGDALAYDIFRHPALHALTGKVPSLSLDNAATICGTADTAATIEQLRAFREDLRTRKETP